MARPDPSSNGVLLKGVSNVIVLWGVETEA